MNRFLRRAIDGLSFVVEDPRLMCDALVRTEYGRCMAPHNLAFMNAELAVRGFIEPALQGLGHKVGALVFQLSPLPRMLSNDLPALIERIGHLLAAMPPLVPKAPDGVIALEVRDAAFSGQTRAWRRWQNHRLWLTQAR